MKYLLAAIRHCVAYRGSTSRDCCLPAFSLTFPQFPCHNMLHRIVFPLKIRYALPGPMVEPSLVDPHALCTHRRCRILLVEHRRVEGTTLRGLPIMPSKALPMAPAAFQQWCRARALAPTTCNYLSTNRRSQPVRRVTSRAHNVSGAYPSRKMGVTIQFESQNPELWAIVAMDRDESGHLARFLMSGPLSERDVGESWWRFSPPGKWKRSSAK